MTFSDWFIGFFTTLNAKFKKFFDGPGGDIVKAAATNFIKVVGAEAGSILVVMAKNALGGKPTLNDIEWSVISKDLQAKATEHGIAFTETMIDYAIGTATAANAIKP